MEVKHIRKSSDDVNGHIRLACQGCQRKKIKCDRTYPCGQCVKSSLQCVASTRKPRARNVEKRTNDSELKKRITKLESLVQSLSSDPQLSEEPQGNVKTETSDDQDPVSPTIAKYIGTTFWSNLTQEVQALRESLEEAESDNEGGTNSPEVPPINDGIGEYDLIVCPPSAVFVMPGALQEPSPAMAEELFRIFLINVDPVFKVFHIPTLKAILAGRRDYLGHHIQPSALKALRVTLWFAAINTLSDEECLVRFQLSRTQLLPQYRRHADIAFANADLINTTDILVIQAYVIYLVSARTSDSSRRVWTMAALVARIAKANNLHQESPEHSPFVKEIRRRLWHHIRVLDAYVAVDRCTEPMIRAGTYNTLRPNNVNDSEFDENSTSVPNHEKGLTEMTYCLMVYSATSLTSHLMLPESTKGGETWQQRLDRANDLGKDLRDRYLQFCDQSILFQRFTFASGEAMIATAVMRAVRPMQAHVSSVPPRVDSPSVLRVATNSIRESENIDAIPESRAWRWIFWVQWHALAVALAGLCSIRDTPLADEAWDYVNRAYDRHSRRVADTKNGMLWRPIEKLYKKASAFREGHSTPLSSGFSPRQLPKTRATSHPSLTDSGASLSGIIPTPVVADQPYNQAMAFNMGANSVDDYIGMNFDEFNGMTSSVPLQNADMMWTDWERIMDDIQGSPVTSGTAHSNVANLQPTGNYMDFSRDRCIM